MKGSEQKTDARDRSIDVLRGMTSFAMVLVNTAGPIRPSWLSHPTSFDQPITFADTLFPCFIFTSGLASARSKRSGSDDSPWYKTMKRAIKLNLLGIAYNNLIPRLTGSHAHGIFDFQTYRIPSVLGRIGMTTMVCGLEAYMGLKPPILPAILGLSWYLLAGLRPLTPLHASSQAWLDRLVFGAAHLHQPAPGFDPEGLLPSLLTVPISGLLGSYLAQPVPQSFVAIKIHTAQLLALGILGSLLTGLLPSPASKVLWTPTYVGQTTATSVLYWSLSKALVSLPSSSTLDPVISALEILGQRSLEIYLISASASFALDKLGTWGYIAHLINHHLIPTTLPTHLQRDVVVGLARSSLLGLAMFPLAKLLVRFNWKI